MKTTEFRTAVEPRYVTRQPSLVEQLDPALMSPVHLSVMFVFYLAYGAWARFRFTVMTCATHDLTLLS